VEVWVHHRLERHLHDGLCDTIGNGRDGDLKLRLPQWTFGFGV
jgi:hypothetical protein